LNTAVVPLTADDIPWSATPTTERFPIDTWLQGSGLASLTDTASLEDVETALVRLRELLPPATDELTRETLRARVRALLKERGAPHRASMVDAALSSVSVSSNNDLEPKRSQATALVDLVGESGVELWHTSAGDAYATLKFPDHKEHHRLNSRAMRDWLARLHHQRTKRTPSSQAIADAMATLGGMARYDGATHDVHVRVAGFGDRVYLDLGDPTWRAVEIGPDGWRVLADVPVRFRRGRALLSLPEPLPGGSLDALRDLVSVSRDEDWHLLAGFLVGALRPSGPYPMLALDGEQGAGKSTTARMLRRLIDPSAAELRAEPREIRDLMVAAAGGWIVALDNLSKIAPWLSDALCRFSTGGALSMRQLYTDDDEHVLEAVRPCILTGITSVITRGDLQDRAIAMTLPAISDYGRRLEAELWTEYRRLQPTVLGALLDATSTALRREQQVRLQTMPRMADWARWVTAAAPAFGWRDETIVRAFDEKYQSSIESLLEGDHVAAAISEMSLPWSGSSAALLELLTPKDTDRIPDGWPHSPRALSGALRRLAPLLRRVSIDVRLPDGARNARERVIRIGKPGAEQDRQDGQDRSSDLFDDSGVSPRPVTGSNGLRPDSQQDSKNGCESEPLSGVSGLSCVAPTFSTDGSGSDDEHF
jgi:hypothetical protein